MNVPAAQAAQLPWLLCDCTVPGLHAVGSAATRMEVAAGTIGSGGRHLLPRRKANHAMEGSLRACT